MAEYPDAIDYFVDPSRVFVGQNSHRALVLHCTGGSETQTATQLGEYFRANPLMTSVHFGVDRLGNIAQYVSLADGAGGNCCLENGHDPFWDQFGGENLNVHTISIECINNADNSLPLTAAQQDALFNLVAFLVKLYNIPLAAIKTHASIAPINRARCPGHAFPLSELMTFLKGEPLMLTLQAASNYFVEIETTVWRCKSNGFILGHGMLSFYQSFGGSALFGLTYLGLPLSNEMEIPGAPGTTLQRFERCNLIYDPDHKIDHAPGAGPVYTAHLEAGPGVDPRLMVAVAQITQLTQQINQLQSGSRVTDLTSRLKQIQTLSTF